MRLWSARNAKLLGICYWCVENILVLLHPLFKFIGYKNIEQKIIPIERNIKKFLFGSHSCGQCTLMETGMVCPMNCPKTLRNGPCGGVRSNGNCEIIESMTCVWVTAWQGSKKLPKGEERILRIQPPLDVRLKDTSAWLRATRKNKSQGSHNV